MIWGCAPAIVAHAQNISAQPVCFNVVNTADFSINGFLRSDFYTRPDGYKARHSSNFKLKAAGTRDNDGYAADRAEFCSTGPFFTGQKLEFTVRTLIPLFSCKTAIDQGDIVISGTYVPGQGVDVSAVCFWVHMYSIFLLLVNHMNSTSIMILVAWGVQCGKLSFISINFWSVFTRSTYISHIFIHSTKKSLLFFSEIQGFSLIVF